MQARFIEFHQVFARIKVAFFFLLSSIRYMLQGLKFSDVKTYLFPILSIFGPRYSPRDHVLK